jgi:hypothetical protein
MANIYGSFNLDGIRAGTKSPVRSQWTDCESFDPIESRPLKGGGAAIAAIRTSFCCVVDCDSMRARRFAIAVIVAICLGGPILELFDRWDPAVQAGNDTEADAVIVALCVGIGFACAGAACLRIRALANVSERIPLASLSPLTIGVPYRIASRNPGHSPPLPLRI